MNLRFIGLATLLLASQASLAQTAYGSAYPAYDYAVYPQSGYSSAPAYDYNYGDPAYSGGTYDYGYSDPAYSGGTYDYGYSDPAYSSGTYDYGYSDPAYNGSTYDYGYSDPAYGGNNAASGYGSSYAPGYSDPAYSGYGYAYAPAYYPPPPPPPRRDRYKAKGLNKLLRINKEVLGEKGVGEDLWPGKPGNMWEDVLPVSGPWNTDWGHAPWNRDYSRTWGRKGGPEAWLNFDEPKEGAAQMWEDMINTPHGVGTQPGGWQAPSISVPNPIDVADEFNETAKDMPDQLENLSEGFTYGGNSWDGKRSDDDDDGGGITFNPKRDRR